jgi:hypothetical protein
MWKMSRSHPIVREANALSKKMAHDGAFYDQYPVMNERKVMINAEYDEETEEIYLRVYAKEKWPEDVDFPSTYDGYRIVKDVWGYL